MHKVCIVVPCFNEEKRINLSKFRNFIKENDNIYVYFVNDGSTDNTKNLLEKVCQEISNCEVYNLSSNIGKAEAVRRGILNNLKKDYDLFGYWDADLSTPLDEIKNFITTFNERPRLQVVTGARVQRLGVLVIRKPLKHYLGRIFATCSSLILRLPYYDTQCGSKLFKKEVVSKIMETTFISKWLFDVEIILRLKKFFPFTYEDPIIYEYPLNCWRDYGGSRLKLMDFLAVPFYLIKIILKYKVTNKNVDD